MSTDQRLRAKLFELYDRHYQRALAGGSLANITDPTKIPRHHLRMWDLTYGHLIRNLPPGSEVLDLGCGTGLFLYWLKQYRNIVPVGVDTSPTMVSLAKMMHPDLVITCSPGLPFLRNNVGRFRGIFSLNVFEHLPDEELFDTAVACIEALTPGGFLCVECPNAANLAGGYFRYIDLTHVRSFTAFSLIQLLEAAGFAQCEAFEPRPARLVGHIRRFLERILHRCTFAICNNTSERVFSAAIACVGWKQ